MSVIDTQDTQLQNAESKMGLFGRLDLGKWGLLIFFLIEIITFSVLSPYFFGVSNIFNIGRSISIVAIVSVGMTIVIIGGGIDLSVGSVMAASSMAAAEVLSFGGGYALAVLAGIATGLIAGVLNGLVITRLRINPIIATLATMGIIRGGAFIVSKGVTVVTTDPAWTVIGQARIGSIPVPLLLVLAVYVAAWWVMKYTRFGRLVYAIGGNAKSCHLAGINVNNWQLVMYTVSGCLSAFGGLVLGSLSGSAFPNAASGMELDIVAATILGGASIAGGIGNVGGTLLGVLIIGVLNNGLVQLNVPTYWQMVAKGLVLLVAVAVDQLRRGIDS